jgi:5-methylcytosine-specific restriction endonuclease McrA
MSGKPWTEERKQWFSALMKGNTYRRGLSKPTGPRGPLSKEHKRKISEALKGNTINLGRTFSEERKRRHSEALKRSAKEGRSHTEAWKAKIREAWAKKWANKQYKTRPIKGRKWSVERRAEWSERKKGAGNQNWKDGATKKSKLVRATWQYREWSKAVKQRDGECLRCGATTKLHAHHIHQFIRYPEKRFELSNGMTLCKSCHHKEHHG